MTNTPTDNKPIILSTIKNQSKGIKANVSKVLNKKEQRESTKKAHLAMMKAWQLISQRKSDDIDAESNI